MALPLAAIVAAGTTAFDMIQRSRVSSAVSRTTSALRQATRSVPVLGPMVTDIVRAGVDRPASVLGPAFGPGTFAGNIVSSASSSTRGAIVRGSQVVFGSTRRRRTMNVANVKALRRASRRVEGFVRLAKSLISMPGAKAKCAIKAPRRRKRC